ncbi:MAG: FMN-binding protein, partial [Clostridia bacterium]|nr:FMN-binding protein [Clostridia bacterium]
FDLSEQMAPNCDLVNTDEYKANFIGKKGPFEVDAVATATYTSKGIVEALNSLFPTQDMSVSGEEALVGEVDPAEPVEVTVPAFGGQNVIVTVTKNADGTIADVVVDASTQSPGLGKKCAEDGFVGQFIGKAAPFVLGENVDAVSYATVTSQAIVDAVNQAAGK